MQETINVFVKAQNEIFNFFGCEEVFPIRAYITLEWEINAKDGFYVLSVWDKDKKRSDYAITKKEGKPQIFEKNGYCLVVAIDCIKTAFLFSKLSF